MKKFLFGLIASIMFGNLSFGQNRIKYSEFGYYHNQALTEFTNKHGYDQKNVDFIIDESINLMKVKYPQLFNGINGSTIKEMFVVKNANDFDYKQIWNSNKENLFNNNIIPIKIGGLIDNIIKNNYSYEQALLAMTNFESSNSLTTDESNCLIAIKSVLISSNQYWNSEERRPHRPGSATLIADFAGLAMFGWGGPVAVIASAAMSYLTYQNDY